MSYSVLDRINVGAYEHPFSGVGIEYYPLGAKLDHTGLLIHEVGFLPQNRDWNFPNVLSPFWRLYYNSKPGHCVSFRDTFYELTPEHIMLIPNHQLFHCLGVNPVPTFWIAFTTQHLIRLDQTVPILLKPTKTQLSLFNDTQKLISQNPSFDPTDTIYRYSLAILNTVIANSTIKWRDVHPPSLDNVLDYIEENLGGNLSNSHLAKVVCLSIEGLSKLFRKHLGISPSAYITQMRIKEAGRLLSQTEVSIEQIALTTGFPNRNYFSRVFKKITNESPAQYRKLHRNYKKKMIR
ncbi:MAG: helix-turn-helix domain-containing protein [Planctomycetota bacterium]|jgi:AraC-like DNA-binding protein